MANQKLKTVKELTESELRSRIRETEAALFQGRLKLATGQLENTASLWSQRKDLARLKTFLGRRQKTSQKQA